MSDEGPVTVRRAPITCTCPACPDPTHGGERVAEPGEVWLLSYDDGDDYHQCVRPIGVYSTDDATVAAIDMLVAGRPVIDVRADGGARVQLPGGAGLIARPLVLDAPPEPIA